MLEKNSTNNLMAKFIIAIGIVLVVGCLVWIFGIPKSVPPPQVPITPIGISINAPTSGTSVSIAPKTDLGEIGLSVAGVDISVIDNQGRRTGSDPTRGVFLQQIPRSLYETDTLGSNESSNVSNETAHNIHIDQPQDGPYILTLNGLSAGEYKLIIRTFAGDGSAQPAIQYAGQIAPGEKILFQLNYTSQPGAVSSLTKLSS
jgi:hypothetical protein